MHPKPMPPVLNVVFLCDAEVYSLVCWICWSHSQNVHPRSLEWSCLHAATSSIPHLSPPQLCEILPGVMQYLPGPQKKALACCEFIHSFIRKEIESHRESGIADESQDFIDCYLEQMAKVSVHAVFDIRSSEISESLFPQGIHKHRSLWKILQIHVENISCHFFAFQDGL